jgi:hypothetical protein
MQSTHGALVWRFIALAGVLSGTTVLAHDGEEPTEIPDRPTEGELGKLIPWHKDAIHLSVVWPKTQPPQLCFWMRPAEYRGSDVVDASRLPIGALRPEFRRDVYGGYAYSNTLDASVLTRILADISMENTLCADFPAALADSGKHHIEQLTAADFAANASAFHDAGHSKGLNYNLFCAGNVMLADGRMAVIGGHDKAGNHGIRKINIYDPEMGRWVARPTPNAMADYLAHPMSLQNRSGLFEVNTDPADPADMHYQRWYPTAVTLPDGKVLILSGTDQTSEVGPQNAPLTKIRYEQPEIYDPTTDRTIALESARKLQPMYPRSYVVQTGHRAKDWKVLSVGEAVPPFPTGAALRAYDPWRYDGKTFLLDVQAALADRYRSVPGYNHWTHLTTAASAHENGAAVNLTYLDKHGMPRLQKIITAGGSDENGATAAVETLDLVLGARDQELSTPGWVIQAQLPFKLTQNQAVALADGDVLIFGGAGRLASGGRVANLEVQLFQPATATLTTVATMNVPRHDHSTGTLLPDGTVLISGGNRVELAAVANDAVPVAQIYSPPYLFRGPRPEVLSAPEKVEYGHKFEVALKANTRISQVSLRRIGPTTHNWSWGNAYVELAFDQEDDGELEITAPKVPGAAVPGVYMLFVLDQDGVPSIATRVMLEMARDDGDTDSEDDRDDDRERD